MLKTLKNKDFFTDESYDKIYPSGSKPATIYGPPKIHKLSINKDNPSLRPIISSTGTNTTIFLNFLLTYLLLLFLLPTVPKIRSRFAKK